MSLEQLDSFFSRFKHITPPDETVRKTVCEYLLKTYNLTLSIKDVKVKNSVIYIQAKPVVKNELFMRKEQLLRFVEEETGKKLHDVR